MGSMNQRQMQFSKRMLMVLTPIGLLIGLNEAWRLAGGLVAIIAGQMLLLGCAAAVVVMKIREEKGK